MKKEISIEDIKEIRSNVDHSVDMGNGAIQHLKFIPSKDFADGDTKLFGITVRQQGRKLIIIIKIYEERRRKEIIYKSSVMARTIMVMGHKDIDKIHIVDSKDILDQMSKYKIDPDRFSRYEDQKKDVTIETIDLITGEMIPVEFTMGMIRMDKYEETNL